MYLMIIGLVSISIALILFYRISRIKQRKTYYIEHALQEKRKLSLAGERISVEVPDSVSQETNIATLRLLGLTLLVLGLMTVALSLYGIVVDTVSL